MALVLIATFAMSRWALWWMGVRFDPSFLRWGWQCLDVTILRDRLWPALLNLHSQPPLFNLFVGVVLKAFPESFAQCFHVLFLISGLVLYSSLYCILRRSDFSRWSALLLSFAFMVGPSSYLYENWLFYTYPVAVLLVVAALGLCCFSASRRTIHAAAFLFLLATVCLTRSAFHLIYLLACIPLVLIPRTARRRVVALCAVGATGLVLSLYVKNLVVFGNFGSSSWMGMNTFRIAAVLHDRADIREWTESGALPGIAAIPPFSPVSAYRDRIPPDPAGPGADAPELTAEIKSNGKPNYNHISYIAISREYQEAAIRLVRMDPLRYARAVQLSWQIYCRPAWRYRFLDKNKAAITQHIPFAYSRHALKANKYNPGSQIYLRSRELMFALILLAAGLRSLQAIRQMIRGGNTSGLVIIFMTLTVGYVALTGILLECEENNRFRVETDPLIFLLTVILCRDVGRYAVRTWREWGQERSS